MNVKSSPTNMSTSTQQSSNNTSIVFYPLYKSLHEIDSTYNDYSDMEFRNKQLNSLRKDYMKYNKDFDNTKRIILLDWIMDVCSSISFKRSTYHLTVVLFDIFMSKIKNTPMNKLQLIGVCCLILSAKVEVSIHLYIYTCTYMNLYYRKSQYLVWISFHIQLKIHAVLMISRTFN